MFSVNFSSILKRSAIPRSTPRPLSSYTESEIKDILKLAINYSILLLILVLLATILSLVLMENITIGEREYGLFGSAIFIHGIQFLTICQMYSVWSKNLKNLTELKCAVWKIIAWFLIIPISVEMVLLSILTWYNMFIGIFSLIIYFGYLGQVRKLSRVSSAYIKTHSGNNTKGPETDKDLTTTSHHTVDIGVGDDKVCPSRTHPRRQSSIPVEAEGNHTIDIGVGDDEACLPKKHSHPHRKKSMSIPVEAECSEDPPIQ